LFFSATPLGVRKILLGYAARCAEKLCFSGAVFLMFGGSAAPGDAAEPLRKEKA